MKKEFADLFVKAGMSIMEQVVGLTMDIKNNFSIGGAPMDNPKVSIYIGITGEVEGHTMIHMEETMALKVASNMMGGMPVSEFDEITKSAVAELGNMILGNTASLLYNQGIKIDITPPKLYIKDAITSSNKADVTMILGNDTEELALGLSLR